MTRRRKGSIRERDGKFYVGMRLRSGNWYERKVEPPSDGSPLNRQWAEVVRVNMVHAYEANTWDPEKPAPEKSSVLQYVRKWAEGQTYESAPKDRRRVELYIAPSPIAYLDITELRPKSVALWIGWLRELPSERGGKLSASSVRNAFDVLQRAMNAAVVDELVPTNPCPLVRRNLPVKRDKNPVARDGWIFTRDQIERLISDESIKPDRRAQYAVLFLTGMRFGEFAALRWRDYDRTMQPLGRITVARAIKSVSGVEGRTKTEAIKRVPVHPTLAAILAEWQLAGWPQAFDRAPTPDDYVLPTVRGRCKGNPRNSSASNRSFKADQKKVGMAAPLHQHVARHSFISLAQDDGGEGAILKWVTHAPPNKSGGHDGYNRGQWVRLCEELKKFRIERRGGGKVLGMREAK
jgi:integrase